MDAYRKILFRASRRGMKEMDIFLGLFAKHQLECLEGALLDQFARLIELPDTLLYYWLTGSKNVWPQEYAEILARIRKFHEERFS